VGPRIGLDTDSINVANKYFKDVPKLEYLATLPANKIHVITKLQEDIHEIIIQFKSFQCPC